MKTSLIVTNLVAAVCGITAAHAGWDTPLPKTLVDDAPILGSTDRVYDARKSSAKSSAEIEERERLRAEIRARYLAPCRTGRVWATREHPKLFVMGGGGASGKGSLQAFLPPKATDRYAGAYLPKGVVTIDPDSIKGALPEYRLIAGVGDYRAAATVHEESSQLSKEIIAEAYKRKCNVLMDVTLGRPSKALEMLRTAKQAGYTIYLVAATVPPEIAIERAASRAKKEKRYVPTEMLLEAHKGFSEGFREYVDVVDHAFLFDNRGAEPELIFANKRVLNDDLFREFEKKRNINEKARDRDELWIPAFDIPDLDAADDARTLELPDVDLDQGTPYIWEFTFDAQNLPTPPAQSDVNFVD